MIKCYFWCLEGAERTRVGWTQRSAVREGETGRLINDEKERENKNRKQLVTCPLSPMAKLERGDDDNDPMPWASDRVAAWLGVWPKPKRDELPRDPEKVGDACETTRRQDTMTTSKVDEEDTMIVECSERERRKKKYRSSGQLKYSSHFALRHQVNHVTRVWWCKLANLTGREMNLSPDWRMINGDWYCISYLRRQKMR